MGIEVRRVTPDWGHPTKQARERDSGCIAYQPERDWDMWQPQHDQDWLTAFREWWVGSVKWWLAKWLSLPFVLLGWMKRPPGGWTYSSYAEEYGECPPYWGSMYRRERWKKGDRTHIQLYETVSEGTPISPHFETSDELAKWCAAQTKEVWVGTSGMTVEDWKAFFAKGGWAPSGVYTQSKGYQAGVKAVISETTG